MMVQMHVEEKAHIGEDRKTIEKVKANFRAIRTERQWRVTVCGLGENGWRGARRYFVR